MPHFSPADHRFMRRALDLAQRGAGRVEPNPMVGCVIVKSGRILGEGYHHRFGGPHAEIDALRKCEQPPHGATVYVSLEPCCYFGKTPPCTDALSAAGVRRVVAATTDPNPKVSGKGLKKLRRAGLAVESGLLEEEAAALIAPFRKLMVTQRPWIIVKWAQSLDGRIATRSGDSKWISDEACRAHAQRVRGRVDAVMVGANTVARDNPALTCRVAGALRRVATRVVLDTHLEMPLRAQLVRSARETPTWIFCGGAAPAAKRRALETAGCRVESLPVDDDAIRLGPVLDALGAARMTNVLVEGGGRVLGAFVDARLADELHLYVAPLLMGGREAIGGLNGVGPARVRDALRIPAPIHCEKLGDGWFVRALLAEARSATGKRRARGAPHP